MLFLFCNFNFTLSRKAAKKNITASVAKLSPSTAKAGKIYFLNWKTLNRQ